MKTRILSALLLLGAASLATAWQIVEIPSNDPSPEHAWLLQMVGEWDASFEATAEPGAEPARWKGQESVRAIGGLWMVAEGSMLMGGDSMAFMLTLGYDAEEKTYVGSWVDSVQSRMWTYRGTLDEARKVLTLEAEGPSITKPGERANYRDLIEQVDEDTKRMTSFLLEGEDWVQYMTVNYQRTK